MKVKVKKLHPDAVIPNYATPGSACFDLYSIQDFVVPAGGSKTFVIGLSFEVPTGYVMKIYSRSGHGFKNGIRLSNTTGILDSDYRGCLMVKLHNDDCVDFAVSKGDRIAQALIEPCQQVQFDEVDLLSETERGTGGLGHTGA